MSTLVDADGNPVKFDKEGYLRHINQWNPSVASHIAEAEGLTLTEDHWEIIFLLRGFYTEFDLSPAMRPLVKYVSNKLGPDKGRSIYLMQLFPQSPAKLASKIAGLPKPSNCL